MRLAAYLKSAFVNQWNLLALVGAGGFAVLSGRPDIALPLVAAAEVAYLGMLAAHPKFQQYVDAQAAKLRRGERSETSAQALRHILQSLPGPLLNRFEKLRARCLELRQIANNLKKSRGDVHDTTLDEFHIEGLDKLLWIFVRLLFTQHALQTFLERTSVEQMRRDIQQLESQLADLDPNDPSPIVAKMRRTLEDHLQTSRDRLENYQKGRANYQLVGLEIDRLENKINSLAEMAINRQEPDFIAGQVDAVAGSMLDMERTMNELQFATGLSTLEDDVPDLMQPAPKKLKLKTN